MEVEVDYSNKKLKIIDLDLKRSVLLFKSEDKEVIFIRYFLRSL